VHLVVELLRRREGGREGEKGGEGGREGGEGGCVSVHGGKGEEVSGSVHLVVEGGREGEREEG